MCHRDVAFGRPHGSPAGELRRSRRMHSIHPGIASANSQPVRTCWVCGCTHGLLSSIRCLRNRRRHRPAGSESPATLDSSYHRCAEARGGVQHVPIMVTRLSEHSAARTRRARRQDCQICARTTV